MRIKTILRLAQESLYLRRTLARYSGCLARGKYHLFDNFRSMSLADTEQIKKAAVYFGKEHGGRKGSVAKKLNKIGFFRNNNKNSTGEYTAFYSANNYDKLREVKLFSFDRNEILTVCTCADDCQKQLAEYDQLHAYFGMPRLTKEAGDDRSYKISMVTLQSRPDERHALENIARCGSAYHLAHPCGKPAMPVSQIVDFSYDNPAIDQPLRELADSIAPAALALEIPLCLQHGDLSRENLIYGTCDNATDFWWIDWEHAGDRLFFYDYFFYILHTALYFSDATALTAYLCGACDDTLTEWFATFGLSFDPGCRKTYFLTFAVAFLKERVCSRGNPKTMQMYYDFIKNAILKQSECHD